MRISNDARRVFICREPINMGKSFNGLSKIIREDMGKDISSGDMFLFVNRSGDYVKIIFFANAGTYIVAKKLALGKFVIPNRDRMNIETMQEVLERIEEGEAIPASATA